MYSSLTGSFGGSITNGAENRSYPFTYSIPVANTWTTISITIAGDTTGTWTTNNTSGLELNFGLGVGSTYSGTAGAWAGTNYLSATGAVSVVGTNAATFYITGVQLEKGTTATSFDYRPYGTELALCQRYLPVVGLSGSDYFTGLSSATTAGYITIPYKISARVVATGITTGTVSSMTVTNGGASPIALTALIFNNSGTESGIVQFTVAAGLTLGQATLFNANAQKILFTGCEL